MTCYGFIGTGSMGSMLIRQAIGSGIARPGEIIASSRTGVSARALAEATGITAAPDNRAVAEHADLLFLCVRPADVCPVLEEIRGSLRRGSLLVSIAGAVSLADLENRAGDSVRCSRVIPSITAEQRSGISLVVWGNGIRPEDRAGLLRFLGAMGTAVEIPERDLGICTNLTSCGPALIAAMVQEFSNAAVRSGGIPADQAGFLARETMLGTARILSAGNMGFDTVIERVATPGGSTEEGVKVLRSRLPAVMDQVHAALSAKRRLAEERLSRGS